jgi:hypothetical protein
MFKKIMQDHLMYIPYAGFESNLWEKGMQNTATSKNILG